MKNLTLTFLIFFLLQNISAKNISPQMDTLPFYEIPQHPDKINAENVIARMIEGLGFRFYWATEGLRPEDLSFRPSKEARTTEETIDHIMGLSTMIINAFEQKTNVRSGEETSKLTFDVKRKLTLENLKKASEMLRNGQIQLEKANIVFKNGDKTIEYPFWNLINGPIEDAVWHVGQVISFRRSSGNPFNSKASVLTGKVRQ